MRILYRINHEIIEFYSLIKRIWCFFRRKKVVHFINNCYTRNAGDKNASPRLYFKDDSSLKKITIISHDMYILKNYSIFKDDIVILGGGGLIDCIDLWNNRINCILKKSRNVVYWGGGFNKHNDRNINTKVDISRFALFGVRDKIDGYRWVPCASCMNSLLRKKYTKKREIGVVFHREFTKEEFFKFDYINNYSNIEDIISFIGESDVIFTSSYHAMYWATLMNKKVILIDSFSNKFENFPYKAVIYEGDIDAAIKSAKNYPNAMQDSIDATMDFFQEIKSKFFLKD